MDKEIKDKLKEIAPSLLEDKDLPLYLELQKINESLEKIAEKEMPEMKMEIPETQKVEIAGAEVITIKGERGESPTDEHLVELITPLIPEPIKGNDGHTPTPQELVKIIKPLIPEPIKGDDGNTPTEEELKRIITPLIPQPLQGSPDTAEQIVEKINSSEGQIDKERIKDLADIIKKLETTIQNIPRSKVGGARKTTYVKRVNLTSQCNGTLKDFALPKDTIEVLGVWGTQFPITFDTADFSFAGNTLTLTSQVSAPAEGQTLFALIETLFYG